MPPPTAPSRRAALKFLAASVSAATVCSPRLPAARAAAPSAPTAAPPPPAEADSHTAAPQRPWSLRDASGNPVRIAALDLLHCLKPDVWLVRATSSDGATGLAVCGDRVPYLHAVFTQRVAPFFKGKDARDLDALVDGVYTHASNYKLAGIAFWCCVAWAEFACLDLLGRLAGRPVAALLGGALKKEIPVYASSMRRDTTPRQEVDWLVQAVDRLGAKAIKLKIGGRMSKNRDASPGRTEQLVALARKTFGDAMTLYVDANGSYDAAHAIEVGRMLRTHDVAFYEEPCEWEDYAATRQVTEALDLPVAGGEQDSSLYRWRQMIRERTVDIVQPDMTYNGGLLRSIRVAEWADARGMAITPHSPQRGGNEPYIAHFAARTRNVGPFVEFNAAPQKPATWYTPAFEPKEGRLVLPDGPGWGITVDPDVVKNAKGVE